MSGCRCVGLSRILSNREEFPGCRSTTPFRQSTAKLTAPLRAKLKILFPSTTQMLRAMGPFFQDGPIAIRTGGCSSSGRAPPLQGGGRGFESPQLHHPTLRRRPPNLTPHFLKRFISVSQRNFRGGRLFVCPGTPQLRVALLASNDRELFCYI